MSLAHRILAQLHQAGVEEILVCPGARNAEFINLLSDNQNFRVIWHFEERNAAFFALGRIQATGKPVAVLTTSGTAAGELLPATMEAYYSRLPLVLITADRPRRFRGSGAPQAAEQKEIFGIYAPLAFDLEGEEAFGLPAKFNSPLHLNICLEDPRGTAAKPSPEPNNSLDEFLEVVKNPLVIVGKLSPQERSATEQFLLELQANVYLESPSGLRSSKALEPLKIKVAEKLFERAEKLNSSFDGVLRIGSVPTNRLWRDLEDSRADLPVFNVSRLPFTGLGRTSGLASFEHKTPPQARQHNPRLKEQDTTLYTKFETLLAQEPTSEPGLVRRLSEAANGQIFLGNSLPIREWDLAASYREIEVTATRGLNGIDGQISTFLGLCQPNQENWALLGDLTALYDLAAPWPLAQLEGINATLVILNNSGGRIFERMFPNPDFLNQHTLTFEPWANLWNLPYELNPTEIKPSTHGLKVIELTPDPIATKRFWQACGELLNP